MGASFRDHRTKLFRTLPSAEMNNTYHLVSDEQFRANQQEQELSIYDNREEEIELETVAGAPLTWTELDATQRLMVSALEMHGERQTEALRNSDSALDMLITAVEGYFESDVDIAGLQSLAMLTALGKGESRISRRHLYLDTEPIYATSIVRWSNCRHTCEKIMMFTISANVYSWGKVRNFFSGLGTEAAAERIRSSITEGS